MLLTHGVIRENTLCFVKVSYTNNILIPLMVFGEKPPLKICKGRISAGQSYSVGPQLPIVNMEFLEVILYSSWEKKYASTLGCHGRKHSFRYLSIKPFVT